MSIKDTLIEAANEAAGTVKESIMLMSGEEAAKVLAPDTTFAIVAEMFMVDPSVDTISIFKALSKEQEYMWGYLAIASGKLRVYKRKELVEEVSLSDVRAEYGLQASVKEVDMVAEHDDTPANVFSTIKDTEGLSWTKGGCAIITPKHKFIIKVVNPIVKPQNGLISNANGMNEGLNPLFDQLEAGGASVMRPSKTTNAIVWIIALIIFAAAVYGVYWLKSNQ